MARILNTGAIPSDSLFALQESSLATLSAPKYATLFTTTEKFGNQAGFSCRQWWEETLWLDTIPFRLAS